MLIALGSNLGSSAGGRRATISASLLALQNRGMRLRRTSRFFSTPCFPAGNGPDYVNACAVMRYDGKAEDALTLLHAVEAEFGRNRVQRWGSRTLDLDLIAFGQTILPDRDRFAQWRDLAPGDQSKVAPQDLILPHPRLQDRGFVLVPLADIAPDWVHPVSGQTVSRMRDALPPDAVADIIPLSP